MTQRLPFIILTALLPLMAHAAPKQHSVETSTAEAKVALEGLDRLLSRAQTLTFQYQTTTHHTPGGKPTIDLISGYAQKPNKFYTELRRNGKLQGIAVCDGKSCISYDAQRMQYTIFQPTQHYHLMSGGRTGIGGSPPFGLEALPILMFLSGTATIARDLPSGSPIKVQYSDAHASLRSKPVLQVTQDIDTYSHPGGVSPLFLGDPVVQYSLDTAADALLAVSFGFNGLMHARMKKPIYYIRLDILKFTLGTTPFPASEYAWKPPANAKPAPKRTNVNAKH